MRQALPAAAHAGADEAAGPSMLSKAEHARIKQSLVFRPDARIVVLTLLFNHALLALGLWLLTLGTTWAYLASQLVFPIVFFQAFSILHDCGHGSCASRTWLNTLIGHYVSPLCFLPYFPWKFHHALHHAWTGNVEQDPSLGALKRWRATQRIPLAMRIAWRSWIPLGAALNHLIFWSRPIEVARSGTAAQMRACIVSVLWIALVYAGLYFGWPQIFRPGNFALALLLYLIAVELVNMPHHADQRTTDGKLPLWQQGYSTRSCYYPVFVSELLVLNFNFHIEHHLFPTLPWYRLRSARSLVKPALGDGYTEAIGIRWNLRYRSQDIREVLHGATRSARSERS